MSTPTPQRIVARTAEIGGTLPVNRVLPTRQRRQIGAWCFLDHAGPARFESGDGMHVGAHPHTCLQTFTWMIEGDVLHRDSLVGRSPGNQVTHPVQRRWIPLVALGKVSDRADTNRGPVRYS